MYLKISNTSWYVVLEERWFVVQSVWFNSHLFLRGVQRWKLWSSLIWYNIVRDLVHRLELLSLSLHQWRSMISVCEMVLQHNQEKGVRNNVVLSFFAQLLKWTKSYELCFHMFLTAYRIDFAKIYHWVFYYSIHVSTVCYHLWCCQSYINTSLN